jgi:hypothetical protein
MKSLSRFRFLFPYKVAVAGVSIDIDNVDDIQWVSFSCCAVFRYLCSVVGSCDVSCCLLSCCLLLCVFLCCVCFVLCGVLFIFLLLFCVVLCFVMLCCGCLDFVLCCVMLCRVVLSYLVVVLSCDCLVAVSWLSCLVLSCLVLPCFVLSCLALVLLDLSWRILAYLRWFRTYASVAMTKTSKVCFVHGLSCMIWYFFCSLFIVRLFSCLRFVLFSFKLS